MHAPTNAMRLAAWRALAQRLLAEPIHADPAPDADHQKSAVGAADFCSTKENACEQLQDSAVISSPATAASGTLGPAAPQAAMLSGQFQKES